MRAAHEISRLNKELSSAEPVREAEIARLNKELSSARASYEAQIARLAGESARLSEDLSTHVARLEQLQNQYDKVTRSGSWRFVQGLVHFPRTMGRSLRWPFAGIAFHKNGRPRGWLRPLLRPSGPKQPSQKIADLGRREQPISPEIGLERTLDAQKKTILVVSHDASRSGGPILALNLIQQLTARYNVISLLLGGGELTEEFRLASNTLYVADRGQLSDLDLGRVVKNITTRFRLTFAIANTIESRRALPALKERGVPTVSLIHEFASYVRPRSIFNDVITLSSDIIFSTRITLENAIRDIWLFPSSSIHVEPQGKCLVPSVSRIGASTRIKELWSARKSLPHEKKKFLVIGVGTVELRKGVDLFISCATILRRQDGGERFQFLWIGGGFDPERDSGYSAYLYDQVKRADLESCFEMAVPTADIELAYETADLLLLASRLDPLPNVAIDALTVGLPVVCFEDTTGIADFLAEAGLGAECVARYLDTDDAARKVTVLADSDHLRAHVSERSREAAKKEFDMGDYVLKIEGIALQAASKESRVREEVNTILGSGLFRYDFFAPPNSQSIPEVTLVEMYVRSMASGLAIRKPMPGFHPTVYAWLKKSGGELIGDPFADFLRKGLPEGAWLQKVIQSGGQPEAAPTDKLRTALHLHAYYPDQLTDIVNRLSLNACAPDLFISVPSLGAAAEAQRAISAYRGRVLELQIASNLGRNFGPLLTQFGKLLCANYDVIGHLHTKKSAHADHSIVEAWRTFLLENMIGGQRGGAMLDAIQSAMALDPAIGIVFPDDPNIMSWTDNRGHAQAIAARMKCGTLPENFNFPIGSMFWVRSSILSKFVELDLDWSDYPSEPAPIDGTILHAIERLFGALPTTMGMKCAVTNIGGITR